MSALCTSCIYQFYKPVPVHFQSDSKGNNLTIKCTGKSTTKKLSPFTKSYKHFHILFNQIKHLSPLHTTNCITSTTVSIKMTCLYKHFVASVRVSVKRHGKSDEKDRTGFTLKPTCCVCIHALLSNSLVRTLDTQLSL